MQGWLIKQQRTQHISTCGPTLQFECVTMKQGCFSTAGTLTESRTIIVGTVNDVMLVNRKSHDMEYYTRGMQTTCTTECQLYMFCISHIEKLKRKVSFFLNVGKNLNMLCM